MKKVYTVSLFVLLIFLAGCSASENLYSENSELNTLIKKIDARFDTSIFAHAHWGAKIQSLETGEVWYERNAGKMFMPASNQKILTSSSALKFLGPDFKFRTELYYTGEIIDSVLNGDLIVWSNGDPTFYSKFYDDPREVLFVWAQQVKEMGIKEINGYVIGDDNAFDDERIGYGWPLNGLDAWYSAEVGPLQINEDYIDLKIIPPADTTGEVVIEPNLPTKYFNIINNLTVVDSGRSGFSVERPYGANDIYVTGTVTAGSRPTYRSPAITNPTLYFTTVFTETLEEFGVNTVKGAMDIDDMEVPELSADNRIKIAVHDSPPLKDILKMLMKRSQNLYAETMPRVMSWKKYGIGSFWKGREIVEDMLAEFGVEPGTYRYLDASGLTRYNYVAPEQIVKILAGMYNSEYKETWLDLQPVAGVDGTLRNRMKGTAAEGNVKAKTGTISNTRGLSGYVTTAAGEDIVFSFLVNGHLLSTKDTEDVTDSVLEMIAEFEGNK